MGLVRLALPGASPYARLRPVSSRAGYRDRVTDTAHTLGRLALALIALAVGAMVGVITTFTHRQLPPWGLIAGLAIIAALLIGVRLAFPGRLIVAAAAVGVVGAVVVLSLQSTGGSVLVADDLLGWLWVLGPAAIAAVAIVWPRRPARPEVATESE